METRRGVVVVRLDGGLGNQLFQFAAGRAAALVGGRELLLDPRGIAARGNGRRYALDAFVLEARFIGPLERFLIRAATGGRLPTAVHHAARRLAGRQWRLVREGEGNGVDVIPPTGDLVLEGYWQSHAIVDAAGEALRRDLAFRAPPAGDVAALAACIQASTSVAVHVRRGDYVTSPEASAVHNALTPAYYAAAGDAIHRRITGAEYFLFSDDPDWAAAHVRLPGPVHVVRHARPTPDAEDLRLMSLCRHAIIANSSFSWWGAWLARHPGQVVVAPRRWFRTREAPPGLLPDAWTVVGAG